MTNISPSLPYTNVFESLIITTGVAGWMCEGNIVAHDGGLNPLGQASHTAVMS